MTISTLITSFEQHVQKELVWVISYPRLNILLHLKALTKLYNSRAKMREFSVFKRLQQWLQVRWYSPRIITLWTPFGVSCKARQISVEISSRRASCLSRELTSGLLEGQSVQTRWSNCLIHQQNLLSLNFTLLKSQILLPEHNHSVNWED